MNGSEYQQTIAGAIGGVGRAIELTFKGQTAPASFDRFEPQFDGTGAWTSFTRNHSGKEWEIAGAISLPAIDTRAEVPALFLDHAKGFLVHEQLHVLLTDFDAYQGTVSKVAQIHRENNLKVNLNAFNAWCANACNSAEDIRIELLNIRKGWFVGALPFLISIMEWHVEQSLEQGYDPLDHNQLSWTLKIIGLAKLCKYPLTSAKKVEQILAQGDPALYSAIINIIDAIDQSDYDEHGEDVWRVTLAQITKFVKNVDSPTPPPPPPQPPRRDGDVPTNPMPTNPNGNDAEDTEDDDGEGNGKGNDGEGTENDDGEGSKGSGDAEGKGNDGDADSGNGAKGNDGEGNGSGKDGEESNANAKQLDNDKDIEQSGRTVGENEGSFDVDLNKVNEDRERYERGLNKMAQDINLDQVGQSYVEAQATNFHPDEVVVFELNIH